MNRKGNRKILICFLLIFIILIITQFSCKAPLENEKNEIIDLEFPEFTSIKYCYNYGSDSLWFTNDDVFGNYEIKAYKTYYNDLYTKMFSFSGTVSGWFSNCFPLGGAYYDSSGADNIWFTDDDVIETVETWEVPLYNFIYNNPGPDSDWEATSDNILKGYAKNTYDEYGNTIKRVYYNGSGDDSIWFTDDDVIDTSMWCGAYYINEYEGNYNRWWTWTKQTRFNGPGTDNIWFTSDDTVSRWHVHEFEDNNKFFTKELIYNGKGLDDIMFTDDDVLYGYAIAVNQY